MLKKIMRGITGLVAILLIGYIVFLKLPGASVNSKDVVAEMSAEDLFNAFASNESTAQAKYLGQAVVISGKIDDIYEDETGAPVVILKSNGDEPIALVTLELSEKPKIKDYSINDQIKIKAQCSGMLMEVTLNKGLIEK